MRRSDKFWSTIDCSSLPKEDSLLACLVVISQYYQNPRSAKSLSARLPLEDNKLTLELFPRAAKRASLNTEFVETKWKNIQPDMLPAIAIDTLGEACILIASAKGDIQLLELKGNARIQNADDYEKNFSGQIILISPEYEFSTRTEETLNETKKNWFWPVIFKSWPVYLEVVVASILINVFVIATPLFVMNVYDRVVPNNAIDTLWVLSSGVFLIYLFEFLLKSVRNYFLEVAKKKTDIELSSSIFSHTMGIKLSQRLKSIGLQANIMQSFANFREFITSSSITLLIDVPFVFLFAAVIYWIGGPLFWVPIIVIPLVIITGIVTQIPLIRLTKQSYKLNAEKQAILFESLQNIKTVKTTTAESTLQARWENIITLLAETNIKISKWASFSSNLSGLIKHCAVIVLIIWGVYLIVQGQLTLGGLIACHILNSRSIAPMGQVAGLFTRYYQSKNALEAIDKTMHLETDFDEHKPYLHRPKLQGDIEFKDVFFRYEKNTAPILKNINLTLKKGERVAFIGRTGSGKSTLVELLLQLYLPTQGAIFIDGTDYRQINPNDLRQQIGYVPQDVSLFYGSIRQNITIGDSFLDDKQLIKVCDIANIGAFSNSHPMGLDRLVGERGNELSGGQRQSVAIARALALSPNVIILDEPTSAMDNQSEQQFKVAFKKYLTCKHTLILTTHKMSMLDLVDRVVVLDDGKIVADGPKDLIMTALKKGLSVDSKVEDNEN
jgi:ATP-binding cassette subfamily C protein LapB